MKEKPPHNLKKLFIRAAMLIVFFRPVSIRAYNHTSPDSFISCYSKFPVHLREYARTHCEKADISYELFLAVAHNESRFQPDATHINKNGTVDRGLCQINDACHPFLYSRNIISSPDDLYNPYININAFISLMEYHLSYTTDEYHALLGYQVGEGAYRQRYENGSKTNSTHQFVWNKKLEIENYFMSQKLQAEWIMMRFKNRPVLFSDTGISLSPSAFDIDTYNSKGGMISIFAYPK